MPGPADGPPAAPAPPAPPAAAVVIAAYQAVTSVAAVVAVAKTVVPGARIYVVDDGSTDGTAVAAATVEAAVLTHPRNRGKGAALATGIARAVADGAPLVVTLDADGQHPPELIPALLAPLGAGEADLVLGARARTGAMPLHRRLSNWLSAVLATRIAAQPVADAQTGFRAFTRAVAEAVRPSEVSYDYEAAFLLTALERGFRVRSVTVPTVYDGAASHFRHWRDAWRVARVFARHGRSILFGPR